MPDHIELVAELEILICCLYNVLVHIYLCSVEVVRGSDRQPHSHD